LKLIWISIRFPGQKIDARVWSVQLQWWHSKSWKKKKSFATWTFALNDDVWHSVSARPLSTLLHFSPVNIGWITKQIKSQTRIV
jgi:hypothetical protein